MLQLLKLAFPEVGFFLFIYNLHAIIEEKIVMWSYEEARELGRMVGQVNAFATDSSDELSIQELMEKYDTHQYSCTNKKTGCYQ